MQNLGEWVSLSIRCGPQKGSQTDPKIGGES